MLLVLQSETSSEHGITLKSLTLLGIAEDEEYESNMILSLSIIGK